MMQASMIYTDLRRLFQDKSNEERYAETDVIRECINYSAMTTTDHYNVMVCCWLNPPSKREIEVMPNGMKQIAHRMWEEKHASVDNTIKYLLSKDVSERLSDKFGRKLNFTRAQASAIAHDAAGIKPLYRNLHKDWSVAERTYYRVTENGNDVITHALLEAVDLIERHISAKLKKQTPEKPWKISREDEKKEAEANAQYWNEVRAAL